MPETYTCPVAGNLTLTVYPTGGVEVRDGVGHITLHYADLPELRHALTAAQDYLYAQLIRECLAVKYLLLTQRQMATKDRVEDIVMARLQVDRGTVHGILNGQAEYGDVWEGQTVFKRANESAAGWWVWVHTTLPEPRLSAYPEIISQEII